jgi:epoxyqueuosine reductase
MGAAPEATADWSPMAPPTPSELQQIGLAAGLVAVGFTDVAPFDDVRDELERRRDEGLHGGMQFTYRNPARSTEPQRLLPGARSLVVGAFPYAGGPVPASTRTGDGADRPQGRVARYATGDHYGDLRDALGAIAVALETAGHRARVVADDNGLVDRAAAHRAGVGWWGRNANVLVPGHGSWVVLGAVVTDADLGSSAPVEDGCGACRRCLDGCPTGAIVAPGVVDARRCLAWLVQAEGPIPVEHRRALADRVYGCDDCQEVCPPSRRSDEGRRPASPSGSWVDLVDMLVLDDDELLGRHGRWYVPRRDPRYLRRNALVALGNVADPDDPNVQGAITGFADGPDDLLAEHARWALDELDDRRGGRRAQPIAVGAPAGRHR